MRAATMSVCALTLAVAACKAPTQAPADAATSQAPAAPASASAAPAAPPPPAPPADAATVERIVGELMAAEYGAERLAKEACWVFQPEDDGSGSDGSAYCMKPGKAEQVQGPDGVRYLYVPVGNVQVEGDRFLYGHPSPGLMGAFRLRLEPEGRWTRLEGERALSFGSNGQCACVDGQFVRLGEQVYGWHFSHGGVWQGIVVSHHALVAPWKGKFANLSAIPEVREEDQDSEYSLRVDDSRPELALYPLQVVRKQGGKAQAPVSVAFDPEQGRYALPGSQ